GFAVANAGQVAGDGADHQAVEQQEEQAAQTQQQAAGEGLKGNADVVHDVEAEHHPIIAGIPLTETAQAAGVGDVHLLHVTDLLGADQAVDQLGVQVGQAAHQGQAAKEQQTGCADAAPLGPHQAGKTAEQKAHQLGAEVAAVTVELLVTAHGQLLQL